MTTTEAPLYVQGLYIRDFKGVSQIDIVPSDYVITFAGENGEGKSSGLDALWSALMWAAASKDIPDVIANGKDEATVRVDLGEYVVTRVWTRDGDRTKTTIEVRDSKGKVLKHTKRVLAEIVGKISLDPTAFGRLRPSEQRDAVIQFVAPQLPFVLVDHDTERAKLAEERLVAGQDSRRLESHHVEMGKTPAGVPTEEVSTKALSEELALAVDIHANVKTVHRDVELGAEAIRSANAHIVAAKAALGSAEEGLAEANTKAAAAAARVAKMNEKLPNGAPNLDEIRERIDSAKGTNEEVRDAKARVAAGTSAAKARAHWKELCDAVDELDAEKLAALANVKMPIDGLGFDDEQVTFDPGAGSGPVPLRQCSQSQRIQVGISLSLSGPHRLRAVRVTDAALFSKATMAMLRERARAGEFQLFNERADDRGSEVYVIESGEILPQCSECSLVDGEEPDGDAQKACDHQFDWDRLEVA